MRRFLLLTANAGLGVLAGFGVADAAAASELPQMFYVGMGLAGGLWAGAAACLSSEIPGDAIAGLPKVVGLVGTLAVCAAALLGHLSPPELKTAAVGIWFVGLATQALGLAMALNERRAGTASKRQHKPAHQKTRGA